MPTTFEHDPGTRDSWSSELWGDPSTRAAHWAAQAPPPPPTEPAPAPVPAPRARRPFVLAAVAVLAVLVGLGASRALIGTEPAAVAERPSSSSSPTPGASPSEQPQGGGELPGLGQLPGSGSLPGQGDQQGQNPSTGSRTLSPAAAAVAPAIVNITSTNGITGTQGAGTGEVISEDGYVITNHHVIEGSTSLTATLAMTGESFDADVVGYDATHDIAVIKLRGASGLAVAPIGDSSTVRVGDEVVGLGNAGGVGGTPIEAKGRVTGLDRSITATDAANGTAEQLYGLIETDADIVPGDSGGSLVDADGKVVGIITAGSISQGAGDTDTDGYAVPINQAMAIADDIRAGRASDTVHIGATAFLGITAASAGAGGVTVAEVVPGSGAEAAGITPGSTITSIGGREVTSAAGLRAVIAEARPGDSLSVTWVDASGRSRTADVTLGTGPVG
jgi:S1-C subfamily serine protease